MKIALYSLWLLGSSGAAPQPEPAPEAIAVAADDLGEVGDLVAPEISVGAQPLLERHGVAPGQVRFELAWSDPDSLTYALRLYVADDPQAPDFEHARVFVSTCHCTRAQLERGALRLLERALEAPPRPDKVSAAEPEEPPAPRALVPPPVLTPSPIDRRPAGLRPLGYAGVATLTLGIAAVASGSALLAVGQSRPRYDRSLFRDLRPSGFALLGVGGAAVVAGAAMLTIDRVRASRARRVAISASLGPNVMGLALHGRL